MFSLTTPHVILCLLVRNFSHWFSGAVFYRSKIAEILVAQLDLNPLPKTLALMMHLKARAKRGQESTRGQSLKVQEAQ